MKFFMFFSTLRPSPKNFEYLFSQENLPNKEEIPSLHVWGQNDVLVTPQYSKTLSDLFTNKTVIEHDGKKKYIFSFLNFYFNFSFFLKKENIIYQIKKSI
jgi:maltose-binding protein MalE